MAPLGQDFKEAESVSPGSENEVITGSGPPLRAGLGEGPECDQSPLEVESVAESHGDGPVDECPVLQRRGRGSAFG